MYRREASNGGARSCLETAFAPPAGSPNGTKELVLQLDHASSSRRQKPVQGLLEVFLPASPPKTGQLAVTAVAVRVISSPPLGTPKVCFFGSFVGLACSEACEGG